ncbi:LLM class flavin-dependent oxidoreductase [Rhizobium leguminosarum]|uniref:LLM class flavin-dependent oxidoreductase n=1 Tax=Rhizobium leguminosarum TaxID=384 RepID=UPI0021BBCAF8|nr:LLM class flavin-dependent oxidoreductase [Rhizobium leguminosarum]
MQKRLILTAGISSTGYLADSWRHVGGSPFVFAEFGHYLRTTRIAHAGTLDAVFFSDHPALGAHPAQRPLHSFEPLTLSTALAGAVPDIGFEITVSSTYSAPYDLAPRLATLAHISGGRVICNIVSSFKPAVAANYGSAPLPPREARYRQAHEFMSVVGALLDSWELGAYRRRSTKSRDSRFWKSIGSDQALAMQRLKSGTTGFLILSTPETRWQSPCPRRNRSARPECLL